MPPEASRRSRDAPIRSDALQLSFEILLGNADATEDELVTGAYGYMTFTYRTA